MEEIRGIYAKTHHHRWNWRPWYGLPAVSAEDGIAEFAEKLSLRFGLFDVNTQINLQDDNLTTDMTISSNMSKEHFRILCCQGRDNLSVFRLDDLMRCKNNLLSDLYIFRVNKMGFSVHSW